MLMSVSIMCTLSLRQAATPGLVCALRAAGMDSVRVNTAHLSGGDDLDALAGLIKGVDPGIKVLIDTKGPELRSTTNVDDAPLSLVDGTTIALAGTGIDADTPSSADRIYVNYPDFVDYLSVGDSVLVDDGRLRLMVESVDGDVALAKVTRGGTLGSRKGVAVEGVSMPLPAVSERDRLFIAHAASSPLVDIIAHSFVRSADDVSAVVEAMGSGRKPIIAKIEDWDGVNNLSGIIKAADGVLIARGDLGASVGAGRLPEVQARIAHETKASGRLLYLATAILPSMIGGGAASDADRAGIATALGQGVDVMLLTNETAQGVDPAAIVAELKLNIDNRP